jgi:hypothetical protein
MAKPIIFGTMEAPAAPKAPDPPKDGGDGWSKAIGQIADAGSKMTRKSKKPWPKMSDSPMPKQSGADNA